MLAANINHLYSFFILSQHRNDLCLGEFCLSHTLSKVGSLKRGCFAGRLQDSIRFDTFRFDYDTKKSLVFSRSVVVLWGALRLATVGRLSMVAIVTTNVYTKHNCLLNHKTVIRSTEPPLLPNRC
jgi:hypothetical protein